METKVAEKPVKAIRLVNTTTQPVVWLMGSTIEGSYLDGDNGNKAKKGLVRASSPSKMYVIPAWDGKTMPHPFRDITAAEWEAVQKMECFRATKETLGGNPRLVGPDAKPARRGHLDTKAVIADRIDRLAA